MLRKILTIGLAVAGAILMLWGCAAPTGSSSPTSVGTKAVWARSVTGTSGSRFYATATDGSGNVYAAGHIFSGTYGFGNGITATPPNAGLRAVLVKYNASGAAQWTQIAGSASSASIFYAVAADSSGNLYAAGYITGTGAHDFGNSVTAAGSYSGTNVVLVKYNSSGTAQWARTVLSSSSSGPSSDTTFSAVSVDGSGNVYAAGAVNCSNNYDFGNSVTAAGSIYLTGYGYSTDALLVKYDASGTPQWARATSAGSTNSQFNAITADGSGNVYATGYMGGGALCDFGNGATATGTSPNNNLVLVKYNTSGTAQWAQTLTSGSSSGSDSYFYGVKADDSGNVYAVGSIADIETYGFGNGVTAAGSISADVGGTNVVLVKYNASGTAQWARTETGSSGSQFNTVTVDSSGSVYAAGSFGGATAGLGNGITATTTGTGSVLLVKYNSSGIPQWVRTASGSSYSVFNAVTTGSSGGVYAAGYLSGTDTYDFGNGVTAAGPNFATNLVLVKYQ